MFGVELKSTSDKWWVTFFMPLLLLCGALYQLLCCYGPLWPINRLLIIRNGPVARATEGITKLDAERMFSWIALFALVGIGYFGFDGWRTGNPQSWGAMLLPLFVYGILTATIFERTWRDWFASTGFAFLAIAVIGANLSAPREDPDDGPTDPDVRRANSKQHTFVWVSAMFLATLSVALVSLVFEQLPRSH